MRSARAVAGLFVVLCTLAMVGPALAHEGRSIGGGAFRAECGWGVEPAYSSAINQVQLHLQDSRGNPVTDAGESLRVVVSFGTQKSDQLVLKPAFGPGYGTPGEYAAAIIPSRPGTYSFHITGRVHNIEIDETFTSSDTTFDNVAPSREVAFPVKDPTPDELATKVEQLSARVESTRADARKAKDDAWKLALPGIVFGLAGMAVAGSALARARRAH